MPYAAKLGPEIVVSSTTASTIAEDPQIAAIGNGQFIVAWSESNRFSPSENGVRAQVFNADGTPATGDIQVNLPGASSQNRVTVAGLADGHAVVVWEDSTTVGDVRAQILDASGNKVGAEFLVNTAVASGQFGPQATGLSGGGFAVSWYDYSGVGGDTSMSAVKTQVFDASGAKVGPEILTNTVKTGSQWYPSLAGLDNGGFVVAWNDTSHLGGDASGGAVKAQIFGASGIKVGGEFLLNTATANDQGDVSVSALSGGRFVATWVDYSGQGGDADGSGVKVQIFSASGARIGAEFLVNTETASSQLTPSVTALATGGFLVSWRDQGSGTLGDDDISVKAQMFDASGAKVGTEFLVNTSVAGAQTFPDAIGLPNGSFVVSWADNLQGGATAPTVRAQVFDITNAQVPGPTTLSAIVPAGTDERLEGKADPGIAVSIKDGTTLLASLTAAADGAFSLSLAGLASGRHVLSAVATNAAGLSGAPSNALVVESGTAREIGQRLAAYSQDTDLDAIVFSDRADLAFATKAELDAARTAYQSVLDKIVGAYTLTVFDSGDWGRAFQVYDEDGHLTRTGSVDAATGDILVETFASDGSLLTRTDRHDGIREDFNYQITGKSYTEQHAVYDSAGHLLELQRYYGDAAHTLAFSQVNHPDGTTEIHGYDTAGRETSRITGTPGGERDAVTFAYEGASTTPATSALTHYGPDGLRQFVDQMRLDGSHVQLALAPEAHLVSHAGVADTLTGFLGGQDIFVFGPESGHDTVRRFEAGAGPAHDVLRFDEAVVSDFADLLSKSHQVGADTVIALGTEDTIVLKGVALAALTEDNAAFVPNDLLLA